MATIKVLSHARGMNLHLIHNKLTKFKMDVHVPFHFMVIHFKHMLYLIWMEFLIVYY